MMEWARVEAVLGVLDRIRPILQADGVNVELLEVEGNNVRIRLTGLCTTCASARLTMQSGLEEVLRHQMGDLGELQLVYE